ncbi:MAG TPA: methionyl-tRNA formyltransferase [Armatimonadota bacterium]|nr:methionyl-tRNA formyltransferase [Armatimonadota bacterium]
MRIIFFGTTDFAAVCLHALARAGHELPAVVTQPDRPAGRGLRLRLSPIKERAQELGLRVEAPADPNAAAFVRLLQDLKAELFSVAAYGHIFGRGLLAAPARGCVNVHASLLPRYRGAAPIHHALLNGDTETGVTIIWMDERMDAGDIILRRALPIAPEEDVGELERKLAALGAQALVEAVALIERGAAPRLAQDDGQATYAPALARARAQIDWGESALQICNLVRGANPTPGAFTFHRGKRLKVLRAQVAEKALPTAGNAGEIVETDARGVLVRAGAGAVLLLQVQPDAKRPMSGAAYVRGYRVEVGEALGGVSGE